jgi:hypothetical protein
VSCMRRNAAIWVCALPPAGEARLGPGALRWKALMGWMG